MYICVQAATIVREKSTLPSGFAGYRRRVNFTDPPRISSRLRWASAPRNFGRRLPYFMVGLFFINLAKFQISDFFFPPLWKSGGCLISRRLRWARAPRNFGRRLPYFFLVVGSSAGDSLWIISVRFLAWTCPCYFFFVCPVAGKWLSPLW